MTLGQVIALIKAFGGSGGGSGGDGDILIVNATFAYDDELEEWSVTLDKTFAEITAASNADKIVLCIPYESASGYTGYPCVMTVESNEAFTTTDVNAESVVYSFDFGVDSNDDTYVTATTWSKSGGGPLVVTDTNGTLDKTFAEIAASPLTVILMFGGVLHLTVNFAGDDKGLSVSAYDGGSGVSYAWSAASADSYPTRSA